MHKQSKITLNQMADLLQALEESVQAMKPMHEFWRSREFNDFEHGWFQDDKQQIRELIEFSRYVFPLTKAHATAKERVLVFDLSRAMQSAFRNEKPAAIFKLMMTEGVQNILDPRSVERMLSAWKSQREAIKNRHEVLKDRRVAARVGAVPGNMLSTWLLLSAPAICYIGALIKGSLKPWFAVILNFLPVRCAAESVFVTPIAGRISP
jgi:hypothetical protein